MSILLFLGPPGSGKSTQACLISDSLQIPLVSMGKLVRLNLESSYQEYKESVKDGNLLPDRIVFKILTDTIEKFDTDMGFVLEGYPRTIAQAVRLDEFLEKKGLSISMVLLLVLHDNKMILNRLMNRIQCGNCGKSFDKDILENHTYCPVCHRPLKSREDDAPSSIDQRMLLFQQEIKGLVDFYKERTIVQEVQADQSIEEVKNQILHLIQTNLNLEMIS